MSKRKRWERLQIRNDLKSGMSESEVMDKYGKTMSRATFWNRMNEIRVEDNEIILQKLRNSDGSFLVTDIKRLDERMGDAIQHMNRLIADPKSSPFVRIEAERLRMEIALAQLKLKVEGPRLLDEVSKPVQKLAEGRITPLQALESLPKVKYATEEERKKLRERMKWAAQVQEENIQTVDSEAERAE